jgi:O-antigen/teichoic acid export membrane protein
LSDPSLKSKATSGFIWNAIQNFGTSFGQIVVGILLARILDPSDFGLIGMLSIFIALSQVFISSGMGSGLIQKQDRTDKDFSTVFVFNLVISVLCYLILYFSAPLIASFYEMPELINLTRVLGIVLIINATSIVQRSKFEIAVDFKALAKVNVLAVFTSGIIAILAAYSGFGVWALVLKTILLSLITVFGLWILGSWKLSFEFSKESFRKLFGYGSKLLAAGIYARSLHEVYNVAIGKAYSASELGFYTQAKTLSDRPSSVLSSVLKKVTFPILSSLQKEEKRMVRAYSQMIRMAAFITFPALTLLAILAEPLVELLLTEKWLRVVPLLQWLCFARIVTPVAVINLNILKAVGRSDLFLKVDLYKFPIIVGALIVTIPISLEAVVIGQFISSIIAFFINAYMPGRLFGYGPLKQLQEMFPMMITTCIMAAVTILLINSTSNVWLQLFIGITSALFTYIGVVFLEDF